MLRVENLIVGTLPPLSFSVKSGEILGVEGRSGSGKTRLLRAIADLDPAPGDVRLDGARREQMAAAQWRRRVRYVAAESGWWAATAHAHTPAGAAGPKYHRLLADLEIDTATAARPIDELSTGERRRIALALCLADDPRCLLLDEPTTGLDGARAALVDELIRYQALSGRVVLLVSHDAAQLDRLTQRRLQLTAPTPAQLQSSASPAAAMPFDQRAGMTR